MFHPEEQPKSIEEALDLAVKRWFLDELSSGVFSLKNFREAAYYVLRPFYHETPERGYRRFVRDRTLSYFRNTLLGNILKGEDKVVLQNKQKPEQQVEQLHRRLIRMQRMGEKVRTDTIVLADQDGVTADTSDLDQILEILNKKLS